MKVKCPKQAFGEAYLRALEKMTEVVQAILDALGAQP
ncbi:hypothetical protein MAXJ12_18913 [Mesorhizobium alhagi CCNWXJ12-2]|uniref:Uncharacterized protein n=1 Tax=Mesorhizobium alhagi CCNWXJ12-2 TaxID=1107882 RepID=H0HUE1_9HYPH|nr:hypothetical protein MAXJ12_18913 [Mesorhizobium alhagi CCNWXJ12-2]